MSILIKKNFGMAASLDASYDLQCDTYYLYPLNVGVTQW